MVDTILNIISTEVFQTIFKLFLISILAGVVGYEREVSGKPAGFRTYILVGISAVLVMICGEIVSEKYGNNDPLRMSAQLLSGIGFIGAGTILSNGFKVKGLTTAASLLAITCIGLTVGAGLYIYAIISTIIVLIILKYSFLLNSKLDHVMDFKFKVQTNAPKDILDLINSVISEHEMEIKKVTVVEEKDELPGTILYSCRVFSSNFDKTEFITEIVKIDKVKQIKVI